MTEAQARYRALKARAGAAGPRPQENVRSYAHAHGYLGTGVFSWADEYIAVYQGTLLEAGTRDECLAALEKRKQQP